MEQALQSFLDQIGTFLWGWPMLTLLIGTGIYLTIILNGLQFTKLGSALCMVFSKKSVREEDKCDGDISHFAALMTALSATVGTGNIAGVATAVAAGGPGALFWMWMTGLLGMATKYAEAVLAVHYREKGERGKMCGGPMYYMMHGLNMKWLGGVFAICLILAALGIGNMVQSNSVADVLNSTFNIPMWVTGIVVATITFLVIIGGIKRISMVAEAVVPTMIIIYMLAGTVVLIINFQIIPSIFVLIFESAFNPMAATGGFAGAAVKEIMRQGFSRGVFSNESGMGSSPIAAAAAKTKHPVEQALISMTQTFIDTLVVCTYTGLILLCTGVWNSGETGASLTANAFNQTLSMSIMGIPLGGIVVSICLIFFAFSTILGWAYYGEKGFTFVFGENEKSVLVYKAIFVGCIFLGAVMQLKLAWNIAEVCTGLMIIPNLIALILLSKKVRQLTVDYFKNRNNKSGFEVKPFHADN